MSSSEFSTTSQFKAKLDVQLKKLSSLSQQQFFRDTKALLEDDFSDIKIHILDEDVWLRHKCVIGAISPMLLDDIDDDVEELTMQGYPPTLQPLEKNLLSSIYRSDSINFNSDFQQGLDLLPLLQNGRYSDITFRVDGADFKCHKCIMSSRCEYFSKMLGGNWREINFDVIELRDISCSSFGLVLQYIYGGLIDFSEGNVDWSELLFLSDMYNLPEIKEQVGAHLRAHRCHFFVNSHACDFCISGAIKTLELCDATLQLPQLQKESYSWFTNNYLKIFSNRCISKCSTKIRNTIRDEIKKTFECNNLIKHMKNCNRLKSKLPAVKWAVEISDVVDDLVQHCGWVACNNLERLVVQASFKYLLYNDKDVNSSVEVQGMLVKAIKSHVSVENCLSVYLSVQKIEGERCSLLRRAEEISTLRKDQREVYDNCSNFTSSILGITREFVRRNLINIRKSKEWKDLSEKMKSMFMSGSGFISAEMGDEDSLSSIQVPSTAV